MTERADWLRVVRVVALGIYAGILVATWDLLSLVGVDVGDAQWGIPLDREQILVWLAVLLVILSIGSPKGGPLRVIRDWLPVLLVLIVYDLTRGKADDWLGISAHVQPQLAIDEWIGFGQAPTIRLQRWLYEPGPVGWWEVPITLTYISHFFVPFVVAAVFWVRDRKRYWQYVCRFVTLSFAAAVTFVLFPAVPPWLAARQGELEPVVRTAPRGWSKLNLEIAQDLVELGQRTANLVAAIPSLHAGYTALVAWGLWRSFGAVGRTVLVAYPLMMAFTLVLTGEHYLVDILIGWGYTAGVVVAWNRLEAWRERQRSGAESAEAERSPAPTSA